MMDQNYRTTSGTIVIWQKSRVDGLLLIIAKKGLKQHKLVIQYREKYEGIASELLLYLTHSYGWLERNREYKQIQTLSGHSLYAWEIEIEKHGAIIK